MSPAVAAAALLARAADFQTAWYLSLVLGFIAVLTGWGVYQSHRALREMWLADDRLLMATVLGIVTVTLLLLASMLAMVAVSFGPNLSGGGT